MRRALILEPTDLDTSQVVAWGAELVLFPAGCVPAHDEKFEQHLLDRLAAIHYNSEDDAFVVVGKASKIARACGLICSTYYYPVFLYWNDAKRQYLAITEG